MLHCIKVSIWPSNKISSNCFWFCVNNCLKLNLKSSWVYLIAHKYSDINTGKPLNTLLKCITLFAMFLMNIILMQNFWKNLKFGHAGASACIIHQRLKYLHNHFVFQTNPFEMVSSKKFGCFLGISEKFHGSNKSVWCRV